MRTILGMDAQVLRAMVVLLPVTGLPRAVPVGDWQTRRTAGDAINLKLAERLAPTPDVTIEYRAIDRLDGLPIPLRIYRHRRPTSGLFLYVHGGGMIMGTLDGYDSRCATYCQHTGLTVVSVDYGRAPEHPFPRAIDDVTTSLHWAHRNADELGVERDRIGIGGDSAGGGLAAAVTLRNRDERRVDGDGPTLAFQMLVYPMLDDRTAAPEPGSTPPPGRLLTWSYADNITAWQAVLGDAYGTDAVSPYAAPARAQDLTGLPRTLIEVGELDIFRAEDQRYAAGIAQAGGDVEFHLDPAVPHGFDFFAPQAKVSVAAWARRFEFIRQSTS